MNSQQRLGILFLLLCGIGFVLAQNQERRESELAATAHELGNVIVGDQVKVSHEFRLAAGSIAPGKYSLDAAACNCVRGSLPEELDVIEGEEIVVRMEGHIPRLLSPMRKCWVAEYAPVQGGEELNLSMCADLVPKVAVQMKRGGRRLKLPAKSAAFEIEYQLVCEQGQEASDSLAVRVTRVSQPAAEIALIQPTPESLSGNGLKIRRGAITVQDPEGLATQGVVQYRVHLTEGDALDSAVLLLVEVTGPIKVYPTRLFVRRDLERSHRLMIRSDSPLKSCKVHRLAEGTDYEVDRKQPRLWMLDLFDVGGIPDDSLSLEITTAEQGTTVLIPIDKWEPKAK